MLYIIFRVDFGTNRTQEIKSSGAYTFLEYFFGNTNNYLDIFW